MSDGAGRMQLALATLGATVALAAGFVPVTVQLLGDEPAASPAAAPVTVPAQALPSTPALDPTTTPRHTGDGKGRRRGSR